MFKLCRTLSVLLCLLAPSHGASSGTVMRVNQGALEYMCQEGKPVLANGLMGMDIPSFGGGQSLLGPVLNTVGINILNVQLPQLSVKLIPGTGVQLALSSDLHIGVNLVLSSLQVRVSASTLVNIRVTSSGRGSPVLRVSGCRSTLGDVQIVLGGTNLLGGLAPIQNQIRSGLMDQLCPCVSTTVMGMNDRLGTMADQNTISPKSQFQYYMQEQPQITSDYIDLDLKAQFQMKGKTIQVPSTGPAFSLPPPQPKSEPSMVNMGISEQVFGNLFATLQQSGAFNQNIGSQQASGGNHLTTSMLEPAIPSIAQQYPEDTSCDLNLVLTELPACDFQEGGALLRINPTVQLVTGAARRSYQTLCTLSLDITLALKLTVADSSVQVSAAIQGDIGMQVASSSVEIAEVYQLRSAVGSVLKERLVTHFNDVLNVRMPLPTLKKVEYVVQEVQIHEDHAQVSCDLNYVN